MPSTQQLEFTARAGGKSQADKILERLLQTPGEWVPMPELYQVSGAFAVHSRVSDLRKRHFKIEQQNVLMNGVQHSYYRLVPNLEGKG